MTDEPNEPLQRWHVGAIVAVVVLTLSCAAFLYAMRADIDKKAGRGEVSAIRSELRDIRGLLCDLPEHSSKYVCRRDAADYREHE